MDSRLRAGVLALVACIVMAAAPTSAGAVSCHDLARPAIRCFPSMDAMLLDSGRYLGRAQATLTGGYPDGYVIVYDGASYSGSSMLLSVDYSSLGTIGWNDRVTSFKSFSATGSFHEHSPAGGLSFAFTSSQMVSNVGVAYNDKFSSLYLD